MTERRDTDNVTVDTHSFPSSLVTYRTGTRNNAVSACQYRRLCAFVTRSDEWTERRVATPRWRGREARADPRSYATHASRIHIADIAISFAHTSVLIGHGRDAAAGATTGLIVARAVACTTTEGPGHLAGPFRRRSHAPRRPLDAESEILEGSIDRVKSCKK
ncbi:hypothetical protein EVAR_950_1 [Eumeta japonica]|uniref:Uncharacterized protein n=1 Tax=Eumeta variegata TaxID=151549 RepID=A0A4C1SH08_EUMVA|nr:hypothetical protein EVAR_950_1 [Eumeta japonica]